MLIILGIEFQAGLQKYMQSRILNYMERTPNVMLNYGTVLAQSSVKPQSHVKPHIYHSELQSNIEPEAALSCWARFYLECHLW